MNRVVLVGLVVLGLAMAGSAAAQPGYGPPPPPPGAYGEPPPPPYYGPPPRHARDGVTIGFGFGLGNMEADSGPLRCSGCDFDPVAVGFDFHIGAMLNPRLALLFELSGTSQQLDADGVEALSQIMLLGAVQWWPTRLVWLKGGIGSSHLGLSYDDGYEADGATLGNGLGLLGAVGVEVLHSTAFAIDVQLRVQSGNYKKLDDELHSATLGVGFNWY
jgi:hypothetical protein